jgi:glycosyltransferase involved in cell wall biosynthesis
MPVATLQNVTSPVRDGREGVVASNAQELREKVLFLLENPETAREMGAAARARVEQEFPVSAFCKAWESLALKLAGK